ncbi:3298_t:CDS:1 [Scutellospora calospora]|uniref:3298_t:CDS:1 n=1 Tax=Scutellospora calospora TaxID=85575 RepID=A0ACA9K1Z2_9GLOM|nr:3298_t:CDS:1 [Scutellospora calospora]
MEHFAFCYVCKVTPVDVDKLTFEPRSRFCSEYCRKEAYVLGLIDREKCRHCGMLPRLILSNGRKVDYCGMICRKEAEKQKGGRNYKSSSRSSSGSSKHSSVYLTLTPDKPIYQPKSKPTTLLQNNNTIKASKSYDNLLSISPRPSPKRSSTYSSSYDSGYSSKTSSTNNFNSNYSSLLTAPPHHNFQQKRSSHNTGSLSLRSPTPTSTKRRSINDVDPLFSVKPPSPKSPTSRSPTLIKRRSFNDIDPLISVTPPSQNLSNNLSPRLPTLTKRRSTNAIEPFISFVPSPQDSYNQINNSSSFINPPPPSHSRRSRRSSHVPPMNGHSVPLISLIPPSYSTNHTNYNNYSTKKV